MLRSWLIPLLLLLLPSLALAADPGPLAAQKGNEAEQVWQAIQQGTQGYTVSESQYHAQLINVQDKTLLPLRSEVLAPGLVLALFGLMAALLVFVIFNGTNKLEQGFSGKKLRRWSALDVAIHWLGAIPCLFLIVTGLTLLAGRLIIEPYLGPLTFANLAEWAKPIHNYMALPFALAWLLMTLKWMKYQLPSKLDLQWIAMAGGYINFGPFKGKHPESEFVNAGEKMWFWTVALCGLALVASGAVLLFPEYAQASRSLSLLLLVIHAGSAIILTGFTVVHVFMATVMAEGTLECMISGYCDENWAKQHHSLWFDQIVAEGSVQYQQK